VDAVSPLLLAAEETPPSAPRIGRARPFFFFFFFFFCVFFFFFSLFFFFFFVIYNELCY